MGSGCGRDGGPKRCKTRVHAFGGLRWGNAWAGELRRWCWVSRAQVLQIQMGLEPWRPSSLSPLASLSFLAFHRIPCAPLEVLGASAPPTVRK